MLPSAPGAVEHRLHRLRVVRTPDVDDRGQVRVGREGAHVGALAEAAHDAAFLGDLQRRRAVGVLCDDVDALVDQRAGRVGFLGRIEPAVDIDHLHASPSGFTLRAASANALMPMRTSGIGNEPI